MLSIADANNANAKLFAKLCRQLADNLHVWSLDDQVNQTILANKTSKIDDKIPEAVLTLA